MAGRSKAQVAYLIVIALLAAIALYYYTAYEGLLVDYEKLEGEYQALLEEHEDLEAKYEELSEDYAQLQSEYEDLLEAYQQLVSTSAYIQVVNNADYYPVAKELIESANESIHVIMFYFKYDPGDPEDPVNELIWAMGNATLRGVELHVILEDSIHDNVRAYNYFARIGANVTFDKDGVRTHCKLIVVDRLYVLVGSHNLTESALWWNNEASVLIKSREVAEAFIKYFNEVWAEASEG